MSVLNRIHRPCARCTETRRRFLKLLAAVPLSGSLVARATRRVQAAGSASVAKLSDLTRAWSAVTFRYATTIEQEVSDGRGKVGKVKVKENIPGVVIRLPEEVAAKRGGGDKGRYMVVDLHCTHARCESVYITDPKELKVLTGEDHSRPAIVCPCHLSLFEIENGLRPAKGARAKKPLYEFHYEVRDGEIVVTGLPEGASRFKAGNEGGLGTEYRVQPEVEGL